MLEACRAKMNGDRLFDEPDPSGWLPEKKARYAARPSAVTARTGTTLFNERFAPTGLAGSAASGRARCVGFFRDMRHPPPESWLDRKRN